MIMFMRLRALSSTDYGNNEQQVCECVVTFRRTAGIIMIFVYWKIDKPQLNTEMLKVKVIHT